MPLVKCGAHLAVFLHGSEVWVPLSGLRTRALKRSEIVLANSRYTIQKFKIVNPAFADTAIQACLLGVPPARFTGPAAGRKGPYALIVSRIAFPPLFWCFAC